MTELISVLTQETFEDYEKLLLDILHEEYETPREGIHLSDLIHCPRQSYFKVILGSKHNERTLAYFFDGAGIHLIMQKLFDKHRPNRFKVEDTKKINDILQYTPDIIDTVKNTILEVKTARSPVINYAPRADHVEQIKAYMAFNKTYNGVIFYHLITKEQNNLFTAHRIQITPLEAERIRAHWLQEAEDLQYAINHNDKTMARHIADDPSKRWMCNGYCDYLQYCTDGRRAVDQIISERAEKKELKLLAKTSKKSSLTYR